MPIGAVEEGLLPEEVSRPENPEHDSMSRGLADGEGERSRFQYVDGGGRLAFGQEHLTGFEPTPPPDFPEWLEAGRVAPARIEGERDWQWIHPDLPLVPECIARR